VDRRESIILTGNLGDDDVHHQFRTQLDKIWESGSENLEIDMSGVSNVDFDSLTELLRDCNRFMQAGTNAELINIPDHIVKILDFFRVPVNRQS
jgi:ABC-type transporter Mla MlaB component